MSDADDGGGPPWDEEKARALQGAIVLVGITYCDATGATEEQIQAHGVILRVDRAQGVEIECHGEVWKGQAMMLPPDLRAFEKAPPGSYRLRSTGETVIDPDYTTSWTFTKPMN